MTKVFNTWFPTSRYGTNALNVMEFGAIGDGVGNAMSTLGFTSVANAQAGIGGNGIAYPSCTDLNQTADWCAITECFKQAFQHETSPGVWVPNGLESIRNRPVYFPGGRYTTRHTLRLNSVYGAWIYGSNNVHIHNEMPTPTEKTCISVNGFTYNRVEGISFGIAPSTGTTAFDLNWDNGAASTVSTSACTFNNCHFTAPGGIGLAIADPAAFPGAGYMASEMHFYHCTMNTCEIGCYIANWNALNYSFIGCGGFSNTSKWLYIAAGGMVTIMNGSLAGNAMDIDVGSSTCAIIATRTESKRFVKASSPTAIISCVQNCIGNDNVFCDVGSTVSMLNCMSDMGRINGEGAFTLDGCEFNRSRSHILTIAAGSAGRVKITHTDTEAYASSGTEYFLDGDQVIIEGVTSSGAGAASVNGVWIIDKLTHDSLELEGSTYVSDTYSGLGPTGLAQIGPGPRYHLRDVTVTVGGPSKAKVSNVPARMPVESIKESLFDLQWADSGKIFDNRGATANVLIRLPSIQGGGWANIVGTRYKFVVMEAFQLMVEVNPEYTPGWGSSPRLYRAGGYHSGAGGWGTNIASNVVGNSFEIYLAEPSNSAASYIGHRWLVQAEEGTWTISGTPA